MIQIKRKALFPGGKCNLLFIICGPGCNTSLNKPSLFCSVLIKFRLLRFFDTEENVFDTKQSPLTSRRLRASVFVLNIFGIYLDLLIFC